LWFFPGIKNNSSPLWDGQEDDRGMVELVLLWHVNMDGCLYTDMVLSSGNAGQAIL
jgi:hypothetical protein